MDIVHCAQGMQFRARLTTFLRLLLQPTQDMIKRKTALPRRSNVPANHPSHPTKTRSLHRRSSPCVIRARSSIRYSPDLCANREKGRWTKGRKTGSHRGVVRAVVVTAVAADDGVVEVAAAWGVRLCGCLERKRHTRRRQLLC